MNKEEMREELENCTVAWDIDNHTKSRCVSTVHFSEELEPIRFSLRGFLGGRLENASWHP